MRKSFLVVISFLLGLSISCAPASNTGNPSKPVPVVKLFTGYYFNVPRCHACVWVDGVRVSLSSGTNEDTYALGAVVHNGEVFTVGISQYSTNYHACYWIGTNKYLYPKGASGIRAWAFDVVSDGTKTYACGSIQTIGIKYPCYWDNTNVVELPYTDDAKALGIDVSGGVVYTGGYVVSAGVFIACYWEGTNLHYLQHPTIYNSSVNDIAIYNGTLYSAGYVESAAGTHACYWEGTNMIMLQNPGSANYKATGIKVFKGTVYICGFYQGIINTIPTCWIGTNNIALSCNTNYSGSAYQILVDDYNYYIGGYYSKTNDIACYWIGNSLVNLTASTNSEEIISGAAW